MIPRLFTVPAAVLGMCLLAPSVQAAFTVASYYQVNTGAGFGALTSFSGSASFTSADNRDYTVTSSGTATNGVNIGSVLTGFGAIERSRRRGPASGAENVAIRVITTISGFLSGNTLGTLHKDVGSGTVDERRVEFDRNAALYTQFVLGNNGAFDANFSVPGTVTSFSFVMDAKFNHNAGGGGDTSGYGRLQVAPDISPVPEPSTGTGLLAALGLAGIAYGVRRMIAVVGN